jgi:hypothetical protein
MKHDTFNCAPVAVGVVLVFSGGYWLLNESNCSRARRSKGPQKKLAAIEAELRSV